MRPGWTCAADGLPWPCPAARRVLREQRGADPWVLAVDQSYLMGMAAEELGVPDPTALYRRFVAWALPDDQVCGVCGRGGHAVLPEVPPRLTPWCPAHETLHPPAVGDGASERAAQALEARVVEHLTERSTSLNGDNTTVGDRGKADR